MEVTWFIAEVFSPSDSDPIIAENPGFLKSPIGKKFKKSSHRNSRLNYILYYSFSINFINLDKTSLFPSFEDSISLANNLVSRKIVLKSYILYKNITLGKTIFRWLEEDKAGGYWSNFITQKFKTTNFNKFVNIIIQYYFIFILIRVICYYNDFFV